jgi:hypothetical protein
MCIARRDQILQLIGSGVRSFSLIRTTGQIALFWRIKTDKSVDLPLVPDRISVDHLNAGDVV